MRDFACQRPHGLLLPSPAMSFLALDVGNTRLKWMLFDHPAPDARALAQGVAFLEQIDRLAETAWANTLKALPRLRPLAAQA